MAHLKGIGVKNFRVFKEATYFNFSKINVLTGPNNSGKSSLLKLLLLLKSNNFQEIKMGDGQHGLGPFLSFITNKVKKKKLFIWFPVFFKEVDANLFIELEYSEDSKNKENGRLTNLIIKDLKDDVVIFDYSKKRIHFSYILKYFERFNQYVSQNISKIEKKSEIKKSPFLKVDQTEYEHPTNLSLIFKPPPNDNLFVHSIEILTKLQNYNFEETIFNYDQSLGINIDNETEFLQNNMFLPSINAFYSENQTIEDPYINDPNKWLGYFEFLFEYYFAENEEERYEWEIDLAKENNRNINCKFWDLIRSHKIQYTENSWKFYKFVSNIFFGGVVRGLNGFVEIFMNYSRRNSFNYLQAIKGPQSRIYKINKGDKFVDVLDIFSTIEFSEDKNFLDKWLKNFKLADSIELERMEGSMITPYLIKAGVKTNLADVGYGMNQILLLLLKIVTVVEDNDIGGTVLKMGISKPSIVFIEEPEANLHPAFQSKLADMFVDASKRFNMQFFIETHSEYLIRKLQYLTAKKEIKPEDSVIYYFNHPDEVAKGAEQVKELHIREDGMMDGDFGPGFFDESTRLTVDLLKLQNKN